MVPEGVFVHEKGLCESATVGEGSRIWAFAHVLEGARVGRNCNICDHVFIEGNVVVGDDVTLKCGVQLWDGIRLGDRVFVGPNATFTNDRFPRSKKRPQRFAETIVEDDASIGANATILPGLHIGRSSMIGAGAVVTKDVPAFAVVVGNPAAIVGYQTEGIEADAFSHHAAGYQKELAAPAGSTLPLDAGGCALLRLPFFDDMRGSLVPIEHYGTLPFVPKRSFLVFHVPNNRVRGEHAHKECEQVLVAVNGSLSVVVDDGMRRNQVRLDAPTMGLYVRPFVWCVQYRFEPETVLLVLASHAYDPEDYLRNYSEFISRLSAVRQGGATR
jgi:UDP-2-acetamido-3-amino-2,3-dideoxy-glucuronate N-acetyltransferase